MQALSNANLRFGAYVVAKIKNPLPPQTNLEQDLLGGLTGDAAKSQIIQDAEGHQYFFFAHPDSMMVDVFALGWLKTTRPDLIESQHINRSSDEPTPEEMIEKLNKKELTFQSLA